MSEAIDRSHLAWKRAGAYVDRMRALVLTFLLISSPAAAQFLDGNELHSSCGADPAMALGYVTGIVDMQILWLGKPDFCVPGDATLGQINDVVCLYLENNPDTRSTSAVALASIALNDAWPCTE